MPDASSRRRLRPRRHPGRDRGRHPCRAGGGAGRGGAHGADAAGRTRHDRRRCEGADRAGARGHGPRSPTWTRCTAASPSATPRFPAGTARPIDGAAELLAALRRDGWRLGLCTNKPHAPTLGLLRRAGAAALPSTPSSAAIACRASASPTPAISRPCWPSSGHRPAPPSWSATAATTCCTARALGVPLHPGELRLHAGAGARAGCRCGDRHAGRAARGPAAARLTSITRSLATRSVARRRHYGRRDRARGHHRRETVADAPNCGGTTVSL